MNGITLKELILGGIGTIASAVVFYALLVILFAAF